MKTFFGLMLVSSLVYATEPPKQPSLYEKLQAACVEVLVDGRLSGTGSLIAPGKIITAAHVVPNPDAQVQVVSARLGRQPTRVRAVDLGHDLVLLELTRFKGEHPMLPLAGKAPRAGAPLQLFGAPLFRHDVMLDGTLARDKPTYEYLSGHYVECLHISGMAPGGMSGGPWVDAQGNLVAVQNGAMTVGQAHMGICFAAPVSAVRALLKQGTHRSSNTLGSGLEELWGQEAQFIKKFEYDGPGLVIRQLKKHGPLGQAGVKEWQVITKIDGRPAERTEQVMAALRKRSTGEELTLVVTSREGKEPKEITLRLAVLEQVWIARDGGKSNKPSTK